MRLVRLVWLAGLCLAPCLPAAAATRTWTGAGFGATGPFWNNITNWAGFGVPGNGDDILFPVNAGNKSSVNNLAVTNYDTIFFAGSNYVFQGGQIGLSGGIVATNRDGTNVFATPLMLRASQTFSNGGSFGRAVLAVAGSLNLNGRDLAWRGDGTNRVVSPVFGAGDMTMGSSGELLLAASNSFSGVVAVTNGNLRLGHPSSLGNTNFSLIVSNGNVVLNTNVSVTNKTLEIGLFSELIAEGGTSTWAGTVIITDFAAGLRARSNAVLRVHGAVLDPTGEGHSISGPGTIIFSGNQPNTANGEDFISGAATWILDKPPGVPATQSRLRVISGSTVRLNSDEQLGGTRTVALTDGSTLDLNGKNESIAFPADYPGAEPGRVLLGSASTNELRLGGAGFTNFSGTVSGAGRIRQTGSGTWVFQGTNSATGTFTVAGGALIVDGRFNASQIILTNGLLGGTGRVAAVTLNGANGVVNPGLGTNTTGRLQIAGVCSWLAGKVQLELNGTTPATQHDQIRVDASLAITNCALEVKFGFAPALGTTFTIITNTAAGSVNGQFSGLPEGAVLDAGGVLLRISYLGGTGNDVTLTAVNSAVTGVTRSWSGAGPDSFWLTPANWFGGTRPQGGDSLEFPSNPFAVLTTNNFPVGTIFNSLRVFSLYQLRGNAVTLLGGVRSDSGSILEMPLILGASQTFLSSLGSLTVRDVAVDTNVLTLTGSGSHGLNGQMTGSGQVVKNGSGQWAIGGTNSVTGTNFFNAGELVVDGAVTGSPVIAAAGTEVRGRGFISRLLAAGRIEPGEDAEETLTIGSELRLTNTSVLAIFLENAPPGLGFNRIVVTNPANTVVLGNATLELTALPFVGVGAMFTIIDKAGAGPITGTFAGLPEGAPVTVTNNPGSNLVFRITYTGGTGNDVVLTRINLDPTGVTRVWTGGGGANTNWSNPANWAGSVAPAAGDALVFPGGISGFAFNNFPASVFFDSLRFGPGTSTRPTPIGGEVPLLSGILVTNLDFAPFVFTPIRLLADQAFIAQNGNLFLTRVFTDGHQLTFDGDGNIAVTSIGLSGVFFHGDISGAGGVIKRGSGTLTMDATNSYTGATVVDSGVVIVKRSQAFGSASSGTTVLPGAAVRLESSSLTIPEPLALHGTLAAGGTGLSVTGGVWTGSVSLMSSNTLVNVTSNSTLSISGVVSGSGGLLKAGIGSLTLEADNSYAGTTFVQDGILFVSGSHLPGAVLLSSNTVLAAGGQIGSLTSTGATVGAGTLTAAGLLQINGPLTFDGASRFDVDVDGLVAGTDYDQVRVSGAVNLGGAQLALGITVSAPIGSAFVIIRKDSAGPVSGTFAGLPQGATFNRGTFLWQVDYFGVDGNDVVLRVISQSIPGVVWDGGGADTNWLTAQNWLSDATPSPDSDLVFSREADRRTNFNNFVAGTSFNTLRFTGVTNTSGSGFNIGGNPIVLGNGIIADSNAANNTLNFNITLGSGAPFNVESAASLRFNGAISNGGFALNPAGPGSLTFVGPISGIGGLISSAGFVTLSATNTFTGSTLIQSGTVRLSAMGALGAPTNTLTIEPAGRLQLAAGARVFSNAVVLRGIIEALSTNTLTGPISVDSSSAVLRTFSSGGLVVNGPLSGSGLLTIGLPSTFTTVVLDGDSSQTGGTLLLGGTLLVNGVASANPFVTWSNTTLGGTGEVGSLSASGNVTPGAPGLTGILRAAGGLTLSNSATLAVTLNGTAAGTDYDQLHAGGAVQLENATLQLSQGAFTPAIGATFTIIRNDSASAVAGTFAGLPQGGFLTNCAVFQISYAGGDGNDVVLTVTAQKGSVNVWTGNGPNTNWTTAANWLCNFPPNPGDDLVFDNAATNRAAQNDFPAGTSFGRLSFSGFFNAPFFLGGNSLLLMNGIAASTFSSNVLSMPVTMGAPVTFSNIGAPLVFRGGITNGGHNLALAGGGIFDFIGPFSGAGGLIYSNSSFGFGQLTLRTNNPYSGPTAFSGFLAVFVENSGALGDATSGTFVGENVQLLLRRPMTLAEPITLAGRLDFANGSNVMAAPLIIAGTNVSLCVSGPRMEFNGPLEGSGRMQLCGIATNVFGGGGSFNGDIEIFAGRHFFNGQYPSARLLVGGTENFSSTLSGTGRFGGVIAFDAATNSIIAPGINGPGILTCGGPLIIESNITLRIDLNGTVPGTGHDQIIVEGNVALTNCILELFLSFTPGLGASFTLLNNTGASPIAGTFLGLPEGATFTLNGFQLTITYRGGDGNDIVISRGSPPPRFSSITLSNGLIQLQILGQPSASYVIEATTNLLNPPSLTPWAPISTNTADSAGLFQFIDADTTNFTSRFYRMVSP